jgi:hypothetical protein
MRACTWSEEVAQGGTAVYPLPCTALLLIQQKLKIDKINTITVIEGNIFLCNSFSHF